MVTARPVVSVLATLALAAGSAAASTPAGATPGQDLPRTIQLPRGWQPEGITTNGRSLFVGSLKNGGIWRVNPARGNREVLNNGKRGRVAVGIDYDARRRLIWVAGGDTGVVRAHSARTGRVVKSYDFGDGRFLNDLTVTRRGVFVTDSMSDELAVVPLGRRGHRLPPRSAARTITLKGDFELVPNQFNLNGIVRYRGRLLAVQSVNGKLYSIHPRTGRARLVDVTRARLVNGDGLERKGRVLYVVRNTNNRIVALRLSNRGLDARRIAVLEHRRLDVPTTAAAARGKLWAVNARFGTTPTNRTRYWITRLPLVSQR